MRASVASGVAAALAAKTSANGRVGTLQAHGTAERSPWGGGSSEPSRGSGWWRLRSRRGR